MTTPRSCCSSNEGAHGQQETMFPHRFFRAGNEVACDPQAEGNVPVSTLSDTSKSCRFGRFDGHAGGSGPDRRLDPNDRMTMLENAPCSKAGRVPSIILLSSDSANKRRSLFTHGEQSSNTQKQIVTGKRSNAWHSSGQGYGHTLDWHLEGAQSVDWRQGLAITN